MKCFPRFCLALTLTALALSLVACSKKDDKPSATQVALHALKDGLSLVLDGPQSRTLVHVVSSQLAPVSDAVALPRVEQFLANQRANEAIATDIKRLRSATTVTYVGEFANTPATTSPEEKQTHASELPELTAIDIGVAWLK